MSGVSAMILRVKGVEPNETSCTGEPGKRNGKYSFDKEKNRLRSRRLK